jgi:hypothetical protein
MTVSEQIIQVLNDLCLKFGMAIDWTNENILPQLETLCSKFIQWEIKTSIAWIAIVVSIAVLGWVIFAATYKNAFESDWDITIWSALNIIFGIAGVAASVLMFIVIPYQIFDIIEASTFPEETIFEYIQMLLDKR